MPYIIAALLIIIGYLGYLLHKKKIVDTKQLSDYDEKLRSLIDQKARLQDDINVWKETLQTIQYKAKKAESDYYKTLKDYDTNLEKFYAEQKEKLLQDYLHYEQNYKTLRANLDAEQKRLQDENLAAIEAANQQREETIDAINKQIKDEQERYNAILEPLKLYEKEKQERFFYTIQIPEEYRNDINFLLTDVAQKVRHPDIISKLVWSEYVKPNLDDTFKRIEIKEQPGIYKLTNIDSGKSYIGKSTNVKKRISDHLKSTIGISTVADQKVHHAMLETGLWNWTIEVIAYCDKEQLNELEKYYIDFFKTQQFGYNIREGG